MLGNKAQAATRALMQNYPLFFPGLPFPLTFLIHFRCFVLPILINDDDLHLRRLFAWPSRENDLLGL